MITIRILFVSASIISTPLLVAQSTAGGAAGAPASNPAPVLSAADAKWRELQSLLAPPQGGEARPQNPDQQNAARRELAARFARGAAAARQFVELFPEHPRALDARRAELSGLLNAAIAGDNSQEARAQSLLAELRRDERVAGRDRVKLVMQSSVLRLRPLGRDRQRFLSEYEKTSRDILAEFPDEAAAYEGFLRFATQHPDDLHGRKLAAELLSMPAPASVKAEASQYLARFDLLGKSLSKILTEAVGVETSKLDGITVVYAWASWSPGSMALAKELSSAAGGIRLIGVNLDTDVAAAKSAASAAGLAGEQIFDERGRFAPLAQALQFDSAPLAYIADRSGAIKEVSAHRGDFAAKLAALR